MREVSSSGQLGSEGSGVSGDQSDSDSRGREQNTPCWHSWKGKDKSHCTIDHTCHLQLGPRPLLHKNREGCYEKPSAAGSCVHRPSCARRQAARRPALLFDRACAPVRVVKRKHPGRLRKLHRAPGDGAPQGATISADRSCWKELYCTCSGRVRLTRGSGDTE